MSQPSNKSRPSNKSSGKNSGKSGQKSKRGLGVRVSWFCIKWGTITAIWGGVILAGFVVYNAQNLPDISTLVSPEKNHRITIKAENGQVIASYGDLYGHQVTFKDLPKSLIDAVLATEDRRFFYHFGVDIFGMARAAYVNYRSGMVVQGGSTITQQLAKIAFLNPERTFKRKIQEMMIAFWLEQQYSKEEILTAYLNRVYLGAGTYGVSAAAKYYFGKDLKDINIMESCILAGLLKAPTRYSPASHPEDAKQRARQVLMSMVDAGYLSESEAKREEKRRPAAIDHGASVKAHNLYFADWIMEQLPLYVGNIRDNLVVTTTFSPKLQREAEDSVTAMLGEYGDHQKAHQAAMVVMKPDGKVVAMVGGRSYKRSQFNRATKALRQPGSSFKMFVYLTAFEQGFSPDDLMEDSPIQIGKWKPENYNDIYEGVVTIGHAIAKSINSVAVRIMQEVGVGNVIETAHRLGIEQDLPRNASIALGTSEVTVLEMTRSYAALANRGYFAMSYGIKKIEDSKANVIYERSYSPSGRVVSEQALLKMNASLMNVVKSGTANAAQIGRPAAAKTGTSQSFRDAWFLGYTGNYVAGVWVGNDNYSPMEGITGGKVPALIWKDFMLKAHQGEPVIDLPAAYYPDGIDEKIQETKDKPSFWNFFGSNETSGKVEYSYPTSR